MWYLYIVRCRDKSLYTGVTTDVDRRLEAHNSGKGSRALRGKLPAVLVHQERFGSQRGALRREAQIKSWPRAKKVALLAKAA